MLVSEQLIHRSLHCGREHACPLPQQVKPDPSGPGRLQVSAGFSWDVGLNSLKPATVHLQHGDSSEGEESEEMDKVGPAAGAMSMRMQMRGGNHRVPNNTI